MKLTKRAIDAMQYEGDGTSRDVRWDDELRGFGVRVYPSGQKAFVLSYRAQGRKRLMTIGAYGVQTLDQARGEARRHLVDVERANVDPLETRKRLAAGETMADLCEAYLERHAKLVKRSWRDDERRINGRIIPKLGNVKASAVKRADVAALHTKIGKTAPYEANRVTALISKMFSLAEAWGFVDDGHPNPARGIEKYAEQKRDRWVTQDELPRLAQAINAEPNVYTRSALWLYLLTGARKSELLRAEWAHIDEQRAELRLPETKAGRVHHVPLSAPALAVLEQIPRMEGNPHVFPGRRRGRHLVNIEKPWRSVRSAAGVADVRLHDLRRTVGSWLAQAGNSLHLIGRVLNHSNTSTTAIYARFAQDHVRDALERHAQLVLGVAGVKPGAEVIQLERAKKAKKKRARK